MFNKKFCFQNKNYKLPDASYIYKYHKDEYKSLQSIKTKLNCVKNKLNNFNLELWSAHTKKTNIAGEVPYNVRNSHYFFF